jgi:hypothetical protein
MNIVVHRALEQVELALWSVAKNLQRKRRTRNLTDWNSVDIEEINNEMGDGIIAEIGEVLETIGCCHGHDIKKTPPMMYPEMILCAVRHHSSPRVTATTGNE